MASALLASRNDEPRWGEHKVYKRKNPYTNPRHCPNPTPNPSFNQIPKDHASNRQDHIYAMESDEPVGPATVAASGDSSSFNRRDSGGYVTFNISSYSNKELRELKRRLISELDQVRSFGSWIESRSAAFPIIAGADEALIARSEIKKQPELMKLHTAMMKKCSQILTKLMKHKTGLWFNSPVDVVGMGLHDYHQIIKDPMDLGTVRSKLSKGFYTSPLDFASDIRLTFKNALIYNPQGHEVHRFADLLLKQFEGSFGPSYAKHEKQRASILRQVEEKKQRIISSWARVVPVVVPAPLISPPPVQMPRPQSPPMVQPLPKPQPQQQLPPQQAPTKMVRHPTKLKANEANNREMSREEKEKLSAAIENLPCESMSEVLDIVSKRNVMSQEGDEVELDLEMMDNETLWELDRFVVNWGKMISKMKKQQENIAAPPLSHPSDAGNKPPVAGEAPEAHVAKKSKKGDHVDEVVDIGDEMPATNYPSVEIAKESSSSSSGSDSPSSSDSDSGSSSGSDSDDSDDDVSRGSPRS